MKNIVIKQMEITAFKGISRLSLALDGCSAAIAGRNGTGKTTVYDAFLWLLFGKDSTEAKADVKPVDAFGNRKSGVDCSVTAVLCADGRDITLRKDWREVWRKPTGGGEAVYDRDETLCWIDEVPKKIDKEYQPYVLSLMGENEAVFKLITDHGAFMRLNWNDRRKELLSIAGGNPDAELQANPEYAGVRELLAGGTPEDAKKRLSAQSKRYAEELKQLPVRIDELEKTLAPVTEEDISAANQSIARTEMSIAQVDAELNDTKGAMEQMNALLRDKAAVERELNAIRGAKMQEKQHTESEHHRRMMEAKCRYDELSREARSLGANLCNTERCIQSWEENKKTLLDSYHQLEAEVYAAPEINDTCPTCGQALPADQVEAAREKHRAEWLDAHAKQIDQVLAKGKELKTMIEAENAKVGQMQESAAEKRSQAETMIDEIKALETKYNALCAEEIDYDGNADYQAAKAKLDGLTAQIEAFGTDTRREELTAKRDELSAKLDAPRAVLLTAQHSRMVKTRIAQLLDEKKRLGAQLVEVDGALDLLGRYVSARCGAMESAINQHFETIRWKLFDFDKSGNVHDCCDATVNGVPYGGGLNNGACINAGIEIIRVLSRAYGVTAPCFVDNAEAVNELARTDGQMIELRVSTDEALVMTKLDDLSLAQAM